MHNFEIWGKYCSALALPYSPSPYPKPHSKIHFQFKILKKSNTGCGKNTGTLNFFQRFSNSWIYVENQQ
jgi:hypothetical protein